MSKHDKQVAGALSQIEAVAKQTATAKDADLKAMRIAKPRNDMVLVYIRQRDMVRRIAVPQRSIEGKDFIVIRCGPKVENLDRGDMVLLIGQQGVDYAPLPGSTHLLVTKQANVLLSVGHVPEEEMPDRPGVELET